MQTGLCLSSWAQKCSKFLQRLNIPVCRILLALLSFTAPCTAAVSGYGLVMISDDMFIKSPCNLFSVKVLKNVTLVGTPAFCPFLVCLDHHSTNSTVQPVTDKGGGEARGHPRTPYQWVWVKTWRFHITNKQSIQFLGEREDVHSTIGQFRGGLELRLGNKNILNFKWFFATYVKFTKASEFSLKN